MEWKGRDHYWGFMPGRRCGMIGFFEDEAGYRFATLRIFLASDIFGLAVGRPFSTFVEGRLLLRKLRGFNTSNFLLAKLLVLVSHSLSGEGRSCLAMR